MSRPAEVEQPHRPWSRRKPYALAGIGCEDYGQHVSGDPVHDRRRLRRIGKRELETLTWDARR
jgi:hypothetical protein